MLHFGIIILHVTARKLSRFNGKNWGFCYKIDTLMVLFGGLKWKLFSLLLSTAMPVTVEIATYFQKGSENDKNGLISTFFSKMFHYLFFLIP